MEEERQKKKCKRSRHWDETETKALINKWSEENIQERLKSCTRKKSIWEEIASFINATGYQDRDYESCKIRIHTLVNAYRHYKDAKRNHTGTAPPKKPPCFEELDVILGEKPTTLPTHLISSTKSASSVENSRDSDSSVDDDVPLEDLIRSGDLPIETENVQGGPSRSDTSTAGEANSSSDRFYFNKSSKKRSRSDMLFDRLNHTMNSFMKAQSEADKDFLENLFDKPTGPTVENLKPIVVKLREKGDGYCIEFELDEKRSMESLLELVKVEYQLDTSESPLITKRPDILIRNNRDVEGLQTGDQVEFVRIENEQD